MKVTYRRIDNGPVVAQNTKGRSYYLGEHLSVFKNVLDAKRYLDENDSDEYVKFAIVEHDHPFVAKLRFTGDIEGTRSSQIFYFEDLSRGVNYPVYAGDVAKLIEHMNYGFVHGTFRFRKRGTAIGLTPVELYDAKVAMTSYGE